MREASHEKVEGFLQDLEQALGRSAGQARRVVDEVRADLEAHVERLRHDGVEEDEAVRRALDDLGNPYELAHRMRREIPPFGGPVLTTLRTLAAAGVVLWMLLLLWTFRAWEYGFRPSATGLVVGFHLPVALLLWPRIVWRRNWMFASGIAALAAVVAIGLALGGVRSTSVNETLLVMNEGGGLAAPSPVEVAVAEEEPSRWPWYLVGAGLSGLTLLLLASMQRRVQQRIAILALVASVAAVEVPFQVEELIFRGEVERFRSYLETAAARTGSLPTSEQIAEEGPRSSSPHAWVRGTVEDWSLFWARPLSPGASLIYSSADGAVVAQD